ncbi:MAG: hypothetical protein ACI8PQ_002031 [Planctomycetota bacterium]
MAAEPGAGTTSHLDFLLECIGFPPDTDLVELAAQIVRQGEPVAWRGPSGLHLRLALGNGLEVRLDREEGEDHDALWPHHEVQRRLRVAVRSVTGLPDSPFDALLYGLANPPVPGQDEGYGADLVEGGGEDWPLATYLSDARRVPRTTPVGHVIAVSIAGFSLDVSYVGPDEGIANPQVKSEPQGALLLPVGEPDRPGGAMELSLRILRVRSVLNSLTGETVQILEVDTPGRPMDLFVSPWQLTEAGLPKPRMGWRIEGAFLFTGRVSGGLPSPQRRAGGTFG